MVAAPAQPRCLAILASAVWRETPDSPNPDVSFIPPLERRRLSMIERAALCVGRAVSTQSELPVVFASRWGEIRVTEKLMRQFAELGEMSPAGFSGSVHNAAPGAFSILTKNRAPYTAIAARERSLECGLLQSALMNEETIFIYAEESAPEIYRALPGAPQVSCAAALRLAPDPEGEIEFSPAAREAAPIAFDTFTAFLRGEANSLAAAHFQLNRRA